MITNNLRVTLRHLGRQKLNTTLHIIGLTLGMSVCLVIGLFLQYELSFDAYHDNATRTYRINSIWMYGGKEDYHFSTPMPMADAVRTSVSGLEHVTLAHPQSGNIVEINPQKRFMEDRTIITQPEFLDVFNVEVVEGNAYDALREPYRALLTESAAKKYFGKEEPLGKTFKYKNEFNITVAAIIRDQPANTHLPFTMLLSYVPNENFLRSGVNAWSYVSGTTTYVVIPENYDIRILETQLQAIADKNINADPHLPKGMKSSFDVQPLGDVHFNSKYAGGGEWVKAVNKSWLWFFASIGLAVLVLAGINFVNLSTAQALRRSKETGIRKSVGAGKWQLLMQFLGEAWMLAFIAGVLAVIITQMSLPQINTILEKGITFDLFHSPDLLLTLLFGIFITGLLAGLYPAWVITKFNPTVALRAGGSTVAGDHGSSWIRKGLVVTQFTISAGLLIAVLLMSQQVKYLRNKNLGFDKDNIINVPIRGAEKAPGFAIELDQMPQVKDVSFATGTPSNEGHWGTMMSLTDGNDLDRQQVTLILGDDHFCKMYGLHLRAGRLLEASDTNAVARSLPREKQIAKVVVNEKLVQAMGWPSNEAAIGQRFWFGMDSGNAEVVGVVADFNTSSLHEAIKPTLIAQSPNVYGQAGIKIQAGSDIPQTVAAIETAWKKIYPEGIFEFKFLDDQIDSFYKAETRLYNLFKVFAAMAMLISCLGLWGLATFSAQQRTKEIGIRKVLGASVNTIIVLLSRDFLLMVAMALAVATPLTFYFMRDWLQNFAYRIDIGWQVFMLAGLASILIALVTVGIQALRAAIANPIHSLKNE